MKRCSMCRQEKSLTEFNLHSKRKDGLQPTCRVCQSTTESRYRSSRNQKERAKYERRKVTEPEKLRARYALRRAVRDGRITKRPCFRCGSSAVEAHHEDYSKPLEVVWACKRHHTELDQVRLGRSGVRGGGPADLTETAGGICTSPAV